MKISVDLDPDTQAEVERTVELIREKPATVLRMAIRAGLPIVANRHQTARPEGYFSDVYPLPKERRQLEAAMANAQQKQVPN
jgi:hypothetical protein